MWNVKTFLNFELNSTQTVQFQKCTLQYVSIYNVLSQNYLLYCRGWNPRNRIIKYTHFRASDSGTRENLLIFLSFNMLVSYLKYVPDLKCVLDNKNAFLIWNVLLKKFHSLPLQIVPIFLRTRSIAFVLFFEMTRWDLSWSFHSFSWKNDRSWGTTPSPTCYSCIYI